MPDQNPQRRLEEVAPGLVRIVDGSTYVYISASSADLLADKYSLTRLSTLRGEARMNRGEEIRAV